MSNERKEADAQAREAARGMESLGELAFEHGCDVDELKVLYRVVYLRDIGKGRDPMRCTDFFGDEAEAREYVRGIREHAEKRLVLFQKLIMQPA